MFDMNNLDSDEIQSAAEVIEMALAVAHKSKELAHSPLTTRDEMAEILNDMADFVLLTFGASQMVLETVAVTNNVELI